MLELRFSGAVTALVTPFFKGEVDFESLDRLLDHQFSSGIDGLVINGTTGESPNLSQSEVRGVFAFAKEKNSKDVPLIMGTGSNSTARTIEATQAAEKWGADAALVVVPYYNKPTQEGLYQHFKAVAECCSLPILLYNVPGRTVTSLEAETIERLSKVSNIVGIKEATGDVMFGQDILSRVDSDFLVTSGDDPTCLELIGKGGGGVISVISNVIPKEVTALVKSCRENPTSEILTEYGEKWGALLEVLYCEPNPIPVKMACYQMGLIRSPEMRLPLTPMTAAAAQQMKSVLSRAGLL